MRSEYWFANGFFPLKVWYVILWKLQWVHVHVNVTTSQTTWNSTLFFQQNYLMWNHDDVIKWKHFPRNWPFVREIHRSPVNFPHKGQWRGALMFSLMYAWINDWVNNREAGDLRLQHGHYDVIVMSTNNLGRWELQMKSKFSVQQC